MLGNLGACLFLSSYGAVRVIDSPRRNESISLIPSYLVSIFLCLSIFLTSNIALLQQYVEKRGGGGVGFAKIKGFRGLWQKGERRGHNCEKEVMSPIVTFQSALQHISYCSFIKTLLTFVKLFIEGTRHRLSSRDKFHGFVGSQIGSSF